MQRNCLYCTAPYKARRATKKYCSDNCKQLAYFKRNGMVFGMNGTPNNLKPVNVKEFYDNTDNVKQFTVKTLTPVNVKHEADRSLEKSQELKPILSEEQLQELIYRINESLSVKIEQAIGSVKKELDVKYASLYGTVSLTQNTKEQVQLCTPVPFIDITAPAKEFIVKDTDQVNVKPDVKDESTALTYNADKIKTESIEDFAVNDKEDKQPEILQCVEFSEEEETDEEPEQEKKEPESEFYDNTDNVKCDSQTPNIKHDTENRSEEVVVKDEHIKEPKTKLTGLTVKTEQEIKEQKYEWVQSRFIHEVWNDYQNNEEDFEFQNDDPNADWVNTRLRCITENVIRLSEYAYVDKQSIDLLNQSLKSLTNSYSFNELSSDYPYLNTINELGERINVISKTAKGEKNPLRISFKLKARLVSMREQFKEAISLIKFSEMNFTEDHRMNNNNEKKKGTWTERCKKYIEAGLIEPDDENEDEHQADYHNIKPEERSDDKRWQYFQKHGKFPPKIAA